MSKKSERITLLIATRNAIEYSHKDEEDSRVSFDLAFVQQVVSTLDALLYMDGVSSLSADSKVGS